MMLMLEASRAHSAVRYSLLAYDTSSILHRCARLALQTAYIIVAPLGAYASELRVVQCSHSCSLCVAACVCCG